jgi:4-amino-4-deoxy-L-arabinose transferase-like glycosyltransferase
MAALQYNARGPHRQDPVDLMHVPLRPGAWLFIAAAFSVLWFAGLDARRLHHPDEGRYAEIAREMHASGDWVTPRLDGVRYFEKPPLQYWLTAAAYAAFGVREWTTRLPVAFFGWLAVLAIAVAGTRIAGPATGLYAAAILGSSVWHAGIGHFVSLDAVLSGCLALALAAFLVAQSHATDPSARRRWMLAAWAAIGAAVLAKGPVGAVIPAGALVVYTALGGDVRVWRRLSLLPGIVVATLIAAPGFVAVSMRNPEFAHFFFVHEHLERFLTTEHQREGAWWYFLPLLALGLLPWTALLVVPARASAAGAPVVVEGFRWQRFCVAWALFVLVFFSASGSKLPSYILPMFPALALLLGARVAGASERAWAVLVRILAVACLVLAVAAWLGYDRLAARLASDRTPVALYEALGYGVKAGLTVMAVGALAAWLLDRRPLLHRRTLAVLAIALSAEAGLLLAFWANGGLDPSRSTADLVAATRRDATFDPSAPFFQVQLYDQTLPWYLGRTTPVVDYRDELGPGLDAEPDKGIAGTPDWIRRWQEVPQGYALMAPDTVARLVADGVPMRVVARTARYVVVARR